MDENEIEIVEDDAPDRKTLVIALAAVGLLALTVVIVRATKRQTNALDGSAQEAMDAGDWRATVQHLAAAMEQRFSGIEQRLDELGGQPAPTQPPATAAVSDIVPPGGAPIIERVPPDPSIVGAVEPPPPAPAAVSM